MSSSTRRTIDVVDVAKLIRNALKIAFPDTKFTVRSSRFAGGASIRVKWSARPIEAEVGQLLERFRGLEYNDRWDTWEPLTFYFRPDGTSIAMGPTGNSEITSNWTNPIVAAVMPQGTDWIRFGADYLHCYREPSAAEIVEHERSSNETQATRDPNQLPF